jgi:INO80 complex subunit B
LILYFSSVGPSSSSDKTKEKGSPSKVLDRSGQVGTSPKMMSKKKKGKGKDSGTSSEEERWLDAIESGKLEEVSCFTSSNREAVL